MGSAWIDAVLFTEAWQAVTQGDACRFAAVAELGEALAPTAERHTETMEQGAAFLRAAAAWPVGRLTGLCNRAPYPVAVAGVAGAHRIGLETALAGFLHAFAANQVFAAIRLVPLGQSDGLSVIARLEPLVLTTAARAAASTLDDLSSATILADITCMNHETQFSRLFRS
jgi:urease accessory protein